MAPDGHAEIGYKITGICSAVNTLPAPTAAVLPAHALLCPLPHKHPVPQHLHMALMPMWLPGHPSQSQRCTLTPALWNPPPAPGMLTPGFHAPAPTLEL